MPCGTAPVEMGNRATFICLTKTSDGARLTSAQSSVKVMIVVARAADPDVDASLTAGDVIHSINDVPVKTIEGLRAALDQLKPNSPVVLQIEREGKLMFVPF